MDDKSSDEVGRGARRRRSSGELDAQHRARSRRQQILPLATPRARILLDMTGVTFMSSAACAAPAASIARSPRRNGKVALVGPVGRDLKDTMSMTGFLIVLHHSRRRWTRRCCRRMQCRRADRCMERIDASSDSRRTRGYKLRAGRAFPFGATFVPGGVNFSVFSRHATACTLVLFDKGAAAADGRNPVSRCVPHRQRVLDDRLRPRLREHRIRLPHGRPVRPAGGPPVRPDQDPAGSVRQGDRRPGRRGAASRTGTTSTSTAAGWSCDDFDWEDDRPLELPTEDLVIYEAHVRSFTGTRRPASSTRHLRGASARRSRT